MKTDRIRKIAIIGGGTAGWMSAAVLSKILGKRFADIELVESDEIGTIGVGEATIPQINTFNRLLGLDEDDFIRNTRATFKLGIEFQDWSRKGERYFHPFGPFGIDMRGVSFHAFWQKQQALGLTDSIADYNLQAVAARENRFMRPIKKEGSPAAGIAYAYHFDAGLYARYLRQYSEKLGVVRTEGKIVAVNQRPEDGFIRSVSLADGREVEADLFLDCSGLRGLLIEQTLKAGFVDWSHWLPCDRAWAVPCAKVADPTPYTRSTAREAGWQWRIPLQHRTGNGYVCSSRFISEDDARDTLMRNLDGEALADPRLIRFQTGRRQTFWSKNVVAIGLASGFIEPLESTSIHFVQSALAKLLTMFPDRAFEQADIDRYNTVTAREYEQVRDFIVLHYKVTARDDTPFWNYVRTMDIPDTLMEKIRVFESRGRIFREHEELFNDTSWFAVMTGQGLTSRSYDPIADSMSDQEVIDRLSDIKSVIRQTADMMPGHADFIARHCASDMDAVAATA